MRRNGQQTQRSFFLDKQTMPDTRKVFFQFPDDEQRRYTLLRFLNRSDAQEFKHVLICALHFSDHVINKNIRTKSDSGLSRN